MAEKKQEVSQMDKDAVIQNLGIKIANLEIANANLVAQLQKKG